MAPLAGTAVRPNVRNGRSHGWNSRTRCRAAPASPERRRLLQDGRSRNPDGVAPRRADRWRHHRHDPDRKRARGIHELAHRTFRGPRRRAPGLPDVANAPPSRRVQRAPARRHVAQAAEGQLPDRHPGADDVLLLVEVADSSIDYDRGVKLALYARFGVPEVWIVDIRGGAVEVCRDPAAEAYARRERLTGGLVSPALVPDVAVDVASLFA